MGIGPAVAIPVAVKSAGLQLSDINLFEINEVFPQLPNNNSLQVKSCVNKLRKHLILLSKFCRHLLPSSCIAARNQTLIPKKLMSMEGLLPSAIPWELQVINQQSLTNSSFRLGVCIWLPQPKYQKIKTEIELNCTNIELKQSVRFSLLCEQSNYNIF